MSDGWISVSERLPDYGVLVLVSRQGEWVDAAMFHFSGDLYPLWRHGSGYTADDVTHWMPLPDSPRKPRKGGNEAELPAGTTQIQSETGLESIKIEKT